MRRCSAFAALEFFTSIAFLVIVLGLAVSLARYVRATSAEQITRRLLKQLDERSSSFPIESELDGSIPGPLASEANWATYVRQSNGVARHALQMDETVSDAWGNAVGYLPNGRSVIGMAPHDRPFCFSAGPDGQYLTQDDNIYSYEQMSSVRPSAAPAAGGHRE